MSSNCSSADLAVLKNSTLSTAIDTCVMDNLSGATFPTGTLVQSCLTTSGISTDCSVCWGNLYAEVKSCMEDTCLIGTETPKIKETTCLTCLTNLSNQLGTSNLVCGIDPSSWSGMSTSDIRNQINNLINSKSSASMRSITTSVVVFALLMIAM